MAKASQTTVNVLRYMRSRPGQILYYGDVAEDTREPKEAVNASLARCVAKRPEYGIRREGSGQYIFRPELQGRPEETEPKSRPELGLYEGVGQTKAGSRVVRDEDGILWVLAERL